MKHLNSSFCEEPVACSKDSWINARVIWLCTAIAPTDNSDESWFSIYFAEWNQWATRITFVREKNHSFGLLFDRLLWNLSIQNYLDMRPFRLASQNQHRSYVEWCLQTIHKLRRIFVDWQVELRLNTKKCILLNIFSRIEISMATNQPPRSCKRDSLALWVFPWRQKKNDRKHII